MLMFEFSLTEIQAQLGVRGDENLSYHDHSSLRLHLCPYFHVYLHFCHDFGLQLHDLRHHLQPHPFKESRKLVEELMLNRQ